MDVLRQIPVLLLGFLLTFLPNDCTTWVNELAVSESGFEGAVTVVSTQIQGQYGVVTVKIPYRNIFGEPQMGLARMLVHRDAWKSKQPLPAFCHVHYEMSVKSAQKWAKRGWAVFTGAYEENYPLDAAYASANNQMRALLQWVRRLPLIDRRHLHIDGGSQGGYMALAMSADLFPVTSTTADVPVVNWAYNLNYAEQNIPVSQFPHCDDSPLPILCGVTILAEWAEKTFGRDFSRDAWYYVSPISYLERIANPVLLTAITGDMLVPMEQMTRTAFPDWDKRDFPDGYERDFDTLTVCEPARKVFEECIPESQRKTYTVTTEVTEQDAPDKPWSKEHPWSVLYLDEGPAKPKAGHGAHHWNLSPDSFTAYYQQSTPQPDILNAAKLDRLLERYSLQLSSLPQLKTGAPASRLNFDTVEQYDVVTALLDYAEISPDHNRRLQTLYSQASTKPFGETISLEDLARMRTDLLPSQQAVTTP